MEVTDSNVCTPCHVAKDQLDFLSCKVTNPENREQFDPVLLKSMFLGNSALAKVFGLFQTT